MVEVGGFKKRIIKLSEGQAMGGIVPFSGAGVQR